MASLAPSANALASPLAVQRNGEKPVDLNIKSVVLGDVSFKAWYPSFYPDQLVGGELDSLYVCKCCFKYSKDVMPYLVHIKHCYTHASSPPGRRVYSRGTHSIYEVDGEDSQLFTQNLSLFAKLFLDNKSIFFDVTSFKYYLLVHHSQPSSPLSNTAQIIGFFSKEKMSWDNNNLACILVFPPWQRKGIGKILMGISYELSRRENRLGGPEKPLSELGRKGYMQFWMATVARVMLGVKNKSSLSVKELAERCWMLPEDILGALKEMDILAGSKTGAGAVVVSKAKVREWAVRHRADLTPPIDERCFLADLED